MAGADARIFCSLPRSHITAFPLLFIIERACARFSTDLVLILRPLIISICPSQPVHRRSATTN